MTPPLLIDAGSEGLSALITRAVALDPAALVRVQQIDEATLDVFVTTPFEVIASRRVAGYLLSDTTTFRATDWSEATAAWPGALPPNTGFKLLDIVPVQIVRQLADQGRDLARQFSGPLGPPKSLLDQTVLTVADSGLEAAVTMRAIFTCTSLGFIPGVATHPKVPRHLRVSRNGRWTRIDAPFGSVYQATGLSLLV